MSQSLQIWSNFPQPSFPDENLKNEGDFGKNSLQMLFSLIWGGTAAALLGEALHGQTESPLRFTAIFLPFNLLLSSPNASEESLEGDQPLRKRIILFLKREFWKILAVSIIFLASVCIHLSSTPQSLIAKGVILGLWSLNILSSFALRKTKETTSSRESSDINMSETPSFIEEIKEEGATNEPTPALSRLKEWWGNLFSGNSSSKETDELIKVIKKETAELKEKNRKFAEDFEKVKHFIKSDNELLMKFKDCFLRSKDFLLSPTFEEDDESFDHPLIQENNVESTVYFRNEYMKSRLRDFLIKNPDFKALLEEKINNPNR